MHGLIFETSVWLLAESTRLLSFCKSQTKLPVVGWSNLMDTCLPLASSHCFLQKIPNQKVLSSIAYLNLYPEALPETNSQASIICAYTCFQLNPKTHGKYGRISRSDRNVGSLNPNAPLPCKWILSIVSQSGTVSQHPHHRQPMKVSVWRPSNSWKHSDFTYIKLDSADHWLVRNSLEIISKFCQCRGGM